MILVTMFRGDMSFSFCVRLQEASRLAEGACALARGRSCL